MIEFQKLTLKNGLRVIIYPKKDTKVAIVNMMYDVGSRDEEENKTGFAHLFEHLMFGGSKNISNFDKALQRVGGSNNAYTSYDVTNYYSKLPASNIETAFWLESDRMLELSFDSKILEIQKKVVIEEYKETYLNKPYGDVWPTICEMCYGKHSYKWPTIGKDIKHIQNMKMQDVKDFFYKFYRPVNAILVIAGGVDAKEIEHLCKKWFDPIPSGEKYIRNIPKEPIQKAPNKKILKNNVPLNAIYKSYHTVERMHKDYYATDLYTNILGGGKSSRLYEELVKQKQYFITIDAHLTSSFDPGLLIIGGKMNDKISFEKAEKAIDEIITDLQTTLAKEKELKKVQNQTEASIDFSEIDVLNVAQELATWTLLGDTNLINTEIEKIRSVTAQDIKKIANSVTNKQKSNTLFYEKTS